MDDIQAHPSTDGRTRSGKARMEKLSPEERKQLARDGATERWRRERARQAAKDSGVMLSGETQHSGENNAVALSSVPSNLPMECGDTFIIEDADEEGEHLHVLLTSPSLAGEVVTASISTRRTRSEALVCVHPGEHPFIRHESIVAYKFSAIRTCAAIEAAVRDKAARPKGKVSPELLKKMQAGLLDSDFTPPGVRAYFVAITGT
jgi:hypothetical protein